MQNLKKLIITLVAVLAVFGSFGMTAMAASDGTITITNSNTAVSINGRSFTAYKILDAEPVDASDTSKGVIYSVPDGATGLKAWYANYFSIDADASDFNTQLSTKIGALDADGMTSFAKALLGEITSNTSSISGLTTATATGANDKAQFTGLDYGYYLVADNTVPSGQDGNAVSFAMITTAAKDANVSLKADAPKIDKKIVDGDTKTNVNEASIGDTVSYELTSAVPDMTGYNKYYYIINDTLSKGLTYTADSMTVKVGTKTLTKDTDYTLTTTTNTDGSTSLKIVFNDFLQYKSQKGTAITVNYDATLNTSAVIGGTTGNPNTVNLQYSNNPNYTYNGDNVPGTDEPTGVTPDSTVKTLTTQLTVLKTDASGKALQGAEFTLTGDGVDIVITTRQVFTEDAAGTYYLLDNGTYSTTAPDNYTGSKYKLETVTEVTGKGQTKTNVTAAVGTDGKVTFTGLGAGDYTLTESKVPTGYNGISPIKFTVNFNNNYDSPAFTITSDSNFTNNGDNTFSTTIVNTTGSTLPNTGALGTKIFIALGLTIMAASAVYFITRRKMDTQA